MSFHISKDFQFSASHVLGGLPEDHPCSRLHGHNYTVRLGLEGDLDGVGFVHDYRLLSPFKDWLDEHLDHRHLNDQMEGNPTAERMARWLAHKAIDLLGLPARVTRVTVGVSETPKTWAQHSVNVLEHRALDRHRWGGVAHV